MDPRWPKKYSDPDFDPSKLTRKQLQDLVLLLGDEMVHPGSRASKPTLVQWFYKVRPIMEKGLPSEHQEWLELMKCHRESTLSRPAGQKTVPATAAANTASTSKSASFIDLTEDYREPAPSRSDSQKTIRTSASARTASTSKPVLLQSPVSYQRNGDVGHRGSNESKASAAPAAAGAQIAGPTTSWRPLDSYAPARRNTTGGVLANSDRVLGINVLSRHQIAANSLPMGRDISLSGTLTTAHRTLWRPLYTPDNPTVKYAEDPSKDINSPQKANSNTQVTASAAESRKRPHSVDHTPWKWTAEPVPAGLLKRLGLADMITDENAEAERRRKRMRL
ncbi:hypothetical protein BJ546DRAFT_948253 [Cryomyces antarcticus]|uniref:Uncharacterized protein n=1 Tax=Cryomyces antarcticus TaxID=329879 RepID=A0ABR0KUX8_9PEZI|nr:hypothetical protein LTR39_000024 [Cryomyces antarcticus]KAK5021161.1 hypothetical protein LTR60_000098 [Cryomyces antarcticus]KAK5132124.1 hypothetical protein LTR16_000003 [Cryomyces antarcticus]